MIQIRQNVFETNSSSVHSITICKEDEYRRWKDGEVLFINEYPSTLDPNLLDLVQDKIFITEEDAKKVAAKVPYYYKFEDMFITYEDFFDDYWLDHYEEHKTIDNINIVAFGSYGRDD